MTIRIVPLLLGLLLLTGISTTVHAQTEPAQASERVFELRTYTTHEGKLDDLHQRFENHSIRILAKHRMHSVAYWVPQDPELVDNTLIYIVWHDSEEAVAENWETFLADPEWQEVARASQVDGPIVSNVESVVLKATEYSMLQ